MVTKLDRLARSVTHMGSVLASLKMKGVALRISNLGVDTGKPTGKLMPDVLTGVAQCERQMPERQREGIAKAEGAYKGRKPTARARAEEIKALATAGLSMRAIPSGSGSARGRCTGR